MMKEKISKVKNEAFINHHWGIEVAGVIYGSLYEAEEEAVEALADGQKEQATEGRKSTHIDLSHGATRELQVGEVYSRGYNVTHGEDDGSHGSNIKSPSYSGRRTNLIVNV